MLKKLIFVLSWLILIQLFAFEPLFMRDPAISPDGTKICFTYLSDLWEVDFDGGDARRLTMSNAEDEAPLYSPDGKWIAFNSNREGFNGLYKIPANGGRAELISAEGITGIQWYKNGKAILGTKYISGLGNGFFKVSLDGNRPELIAEIGDSFATLSQDENTILFNRRGHWDRERYKGSHNGELWSYDIKNKKYTNISNTEITERYPVFSMSSEKTYFCESDGDIFQIFVMNGLDFDSKKQISKYKSKQLSPRDLNIARENDRMAFEMFDKIHNYNPDTKKIQKVKINIPEDLVMDYEVKTKLFSKFDTFAVSNNEKFVVFSTKFDLFAMPVAGGEVKQITFDQAGISDIIVMPDNETIYFTSYRKGQPQLFRTSIKNIEKISMIKDFKGMEINYISNAGKDQLLVCYNEKNDRDSFALINKDKKVNKLKWLPEETSYIYVSPDNNYLILRERFSKTWDTKISLIEIASKKKKVLFETDDWINSFVWGKDYKSLFYTRNGNVYRLDLMPKSVDYLKTDNWEKILADNEKKDEKKDKKDKKEDKTEKKEKAIEIDWESLEKRYTKVFSKEGTNYPLSVINDSTLYVGTNKDGDFTVRKINYKGMNEKKVTTLNNSSWNLTIQYREKNFYYGSGSKLHKLNPNSGKKKRLNYSKKYSYNKQKLNQSVFEQVWNTFKREFYDPDMHGQDWEKLYDLFYPYVGKIQNTRQLASIVNELIGEVDASHTGFYPRSESKGKHYSSANLGCEFDWRNVRNNGMVLKKVYSGSDLAAVHKIKKGDVLLSVNGEKITKKTALNLLFLDKADEKLELVFSTKDGEKEIKISPIGGGKNYRLRYNDWVAERRAKVEAVNPEIGYLHIRMMDASSFEQFKEDMFATTKDKKALIIDVRSNGGGRTHDQILEILTKKAYGLQTHRDGNAKKQITPGRSFDKPVVLLINEDSFSDAEIFPHLFKYLKLGKVIGMPTSGSVIGTWPTELMDGSSMRTPGNGWYTLDGMNMEGNGCQPDIIVEQSPEDKIKDNDVQLTRAIEELLKEMQ